MLIYQDIKYYPFQCNLPPVSCIITPCLKSYHSMPHATHHSMSHVLSHLSCLITPCLCVINPCLMQLITFIDLSKCADVLCCAVLELVEVRPWLILVLLDRVHTQNTWPFFVHFSIVRIYQYCTLTFSYLWFHFVTFSYLSLSFITLLRLIVPYWALLCLTGPYWSLLGLTGSYWALLGLTGPYLALLSLT